MPLPQIMQPLLDALSDRIGQSSSVSILDGAEILYVARAAQKKVMSISLMPGSRLPAHCTSMGRVLLAARPEAEALAILSAQPPQARTPRTLTDPGAIMAELARVRAQGFAIIDHEVELGLRSIAVPLISVHGKVVAALNVEGALTCHWSFIQPRPEPVGHLRLSARVEQSPGAQNFHCVQRVGRLRWSGAGRSLRGSGSQARNAAARCCNR